MMKRRNNRRSNRKLGFETVEAKVALTNLLPMDVDPNAPDPVAETSSMVDDDSFDPDVGDGDATYGGSGGDSPGGGNGP